MLDSIYDGGYDMLSSLSQMSCKFIGGIEEVSLEGNAICR